MQVYTGHGKIHTHMQTGTEPESPPLLHPLPHTQKGWEHTTASPSHSNTQPPTESDLPPLSTQALSSTCTAQVGPACPNCPTCLLPNTLPNLIGAVPSPSVPGHFVQILSPPETFPE
jgi:hypothetical protein